MNTIGRSAFEVINLHLLDTPMVMNVAINGGLKHISLTEKDGETLLCVATDNDVSLEQILVVEVHPTGMLLPNADDVTYLGTSMVGGGFFVWHIFYLVRDKNDKPNKKDSMADDRRMFKSLYTIYKYGFAVDGSTEINIDGSSVKPLYADMQNGSPTIWVLIKLENGESNAQTSLSVVSSVNDCEDSYLLLNKISLDDGTKRNVFYRTT